MKKFILLLCIVSISITTTTAQDKSVYPKYDVFSELEDLVGKQFQTYITLNAFSGLTPGQLQDMLQLVARIEEAHNRNWQRVYLGYIKRVEASVFFKTAKIIAQQPGFYQNKEQMKLALKYIDAGFGYLNQYNHRDYPPYIVLDTKWEGSRPTSETKASFPVEEDVARELQVLLTEKTGDAGEALDGYYNKFGINYFLIPYNKEPGYPYQLAAHIIDLSRLLKRYDQRLVDFCVKLLEYNKRSDREQIGHMKPDELERWKVLEAKINTTLNEVIAEAPAANRYTIVLPDNYPDDYTSSQYEWMIPFIYNFDTHERLKTAKDDPNGYPFTLDLMKFCADIISKHKAPELDTAATAMMQKHFSETIIVMHKWFGRGDAFQCSNISFVSTYMYTYPTTAADKKYILKSLKHCKNYR